MDIFRKGKGSGISSEPMMGGKGDLSLNGSLDNDMLNKMSHVGEVKYSEVVFTILSFSGIAVVAMEMIVILIMKKSKVALPMKITSINFIVSDLLFHLVTGGTSLAKFGLPRQSVYLLKIARQFLMGFTSAATFGSVTLMVLERTIAMTWPIYHKTKVTMVHVLFVVATVWLVNICAYCGLVFTYVFGCDRLTDAMCSEDGRGFERFKTFISLRETTLSLVLVSMFEVVYVTSCVVLASKIAIFVRRQQKKRIPQAKKPEVGHAHESSNGSSDISNATKISTFEEGTSAMSISQAVHAEPQGTVCAAQEPPQRFGILSSMTASSCEPAKNIQTRTANTKRALAALLRRSTTKASLIVLAIALLQISMHLPYMVKLVMTMLQQPGEDTKTWKQSLEIISLLLLQICTIPNVYMFVLRLRSCREQAMKMFCCK